MDNDKRTLEHIQEENLRLTEEVTSLKEKQKQLRELLEEDPITSDQKHIYIVQPNEFAETNKNIYKIGRAGLYSDACFGGSPRKHRVLMSIISDDNNACIHEIKRSFNTMFKRRLDIGRQYYEGNIKRAVQKFTFREILA
jgi:hypothetical protein